MEGSPATDSGGVGASLRRRSNSSKGGMADARDPGAATANPRPLTEQSSLLSSISPRSDAVNVPAPSSATLPAREENQQQADRSTLLQHFVTVPTASRKLQGLKNLALCALTFLPYLCSLAVRCAGVCCRQTEPAVRFLRCNLASASVTAFTSMNLVCAVVWQVHNGQARSQ